MNLGWAYAHVNRIIIVLLGIETRSMNHSEELFRSPHNMFCSIKVADYSVWIVVRGETKYSSTYSIISNGFL